MFSVSLYLHSLYPSSLSLLLYSLYLSLSLSLPLSLSQSSLSLSLCSFILSISLPLSLSLYPYLPSVSLYLSSLARLVSQYFSLSPLFSILISLSIYIYIYISSVPFSFYLSFSKSRRHSRKWESMGWLKRESQHQKLNANPLRGWLCERCPGRLCQTSSCGRRHQEGSPGEGSCKRQQAGCQGNHAWQCVVFWAVEILRELKVLVRCRQEAASARAPANSYEVWSWQRIH